MAVESRQLPPWMNKLFYAMLGVLLQIPVDHPSQYCHILCHLPFIVNISNIGNKTMLVAPCSVHVKLYE